jgi:hypothetical protein
MNNQNPPNQKNPGHFSIDGNKLRIENNQGLSSVLFEDISSISYKTISVPNFIFMVIGFVLYGIILFMDWSDFQTRFSVSVIVLIGFIVYSLMNKKKWDNVMIETRGGMLLSYSVEFGDGIKQVDKIEEEKRKITNN